MKNKIKLILLLVMSAIVIASGFILPGYIAKVKGDEEVSKVQNVPEEYFSMKSVEIARKASEGLSFEQKKRLVTGEWDSVVQDALPSEMTKSRYEIVEIAKKRIETLYKRGEIDFSLDSKFGYWFYWDATPKKAVENIFNTYVAFFWEIQFVRSDKIEHHSVTILDDGTIVSVR